jgi:4'-phosphopantetheinyl transferase
LKPISGIYALNVVQSVSLPGTGILEDYAEQKTIKKVHSLRNNQDKYLTLFSDLIVKHILKIHNTSFATLELSYNKHGKPYFNNKNAPEFNIAHSGEYVICGFDEYPVGIDIERIKQMDFSDADYFLSNREKTMLNATNSSNQLSLLYKIWTVKESYLKAIGTGLSSNKRLSDLSVVFDNSNLKLLYKDKNLMEWFFYNLNIDKGYSANLCTRTRNFNQDVTIIDISDIIDNLSKLN